jgi:TRAP-type C4-dicarboxylate transport system permease small subunit
MKSFLILDRSIKALANLALSLAGIGMLFIATIGTADVITYLVLGRPFPGATESVEVALAITVAMTMPYAQLRHGHIVVDIVVQRFSPRGKRVAAFGSLVTGCLCILLLSWRAWDLAVESIAVREAATALYSFPIYPRKILFALGLSLTAIEYLRQIVWMLLGDPLGGASIDSATEITVE